MNIPTYLTTLTPEEIRAVKFTSPSIDWLDLLDLFNIPDPWILENITEDYDEAVAMNMLKSKINALALSISTQAEDSYDEIEKALVERLVEFISLLQNYRNDVPLWATAFNADPALKLHLLANSLAFAWN